MGVAKRGKMLGGVMASACALAVAALSPGVCAAHDEPPPTLKARPHPAAGPGEGEAANVSRGRAERVRAEWVPRVVVSIPPLAGLVRPLVDAIGGGGVEVLIPAGVSEHGYEPTPVQLASVAGADLVVLVGLGLEGNVERFVAEHAPAGGGSPRMPGGADGQQRGRGVVVFAEVMKAEAAEAGAAESHTEHHEHETGTCEHEGTDPHVWLDPVAAKKLVERVRSVLAGQLEAAGAERVAARRGALDAAATKVAGELDALDAEYARALAGHKGQTVVVAHDAYGWLARRYGIRFTAIAGLNAGEPTPDAVAKAAAAVRGLGLKSVYVEPQMSRAAAERVAAATGTTVRMLDPLGTGDYFAMMRGNLRALVEGWGEGK